MAKKDYNGENVFLAGSSSIFALTNTIMLSWKSSNYGQIRPQSKKLAVIECLGKSR